jgi:uncharacterized repeat protein (TIGR01451 family)
MGGTAAGSQPCASTPGANGAVGSLGAGGGSYTEGGGGGGGYYGGNQGGAGATDSCGYAAGAGGGSGGSSYPAADVVTDATLAPRSWPLPYTLGGGDPNGEVVIVYTVSEAAPVFTADSPPLASTAAATYQYQFTATDAASWSLSSDAPSWLTVSDSGLVSGTPPAGPTSFTYSVTAGNSTGSATAGPYAVAVSTPAPDLQVTDLATPHLVVSGKQLTYAVTAANTGSAGADAVVVTDTLPASVHFVSAVSTQGTCTQASRGSNKNKGVTVTCKVNTPLAAGASVTVTITVVATTAGPITDNAGVTALGVTADSDDSATSTVTVQGT